LYETCAGTTEGSEDEGVKQFVIDAMRHGYFPVVLNPRGSASSPVTTPRHFLQPLSSVLVAFYSFRLLSFYKDCVLKRVGYAITDLPKPCICLAKSEELRWWRASYYDTSFLVPKLED